MGTVKESEVQKNGIPDAADIAVGTKMERIPVFIYNFERLLVQAETPHFMQMPSGTLDMDPLNRFASKNPMVDRFQVLDFLNSAVSAPGDRLTVITGGDLSQRVDMVMDLMKEAGI